jgi:hypothetical protein
MSSYNDPSHPYVMQFDFEVGLAEKHTVEFRFNQSFGNIRISVDGKPVTRRIRPFAFSTLERFRLSVGDAERHEVVIEKRRPRLFGGFVPQSCLVYVDGTVIGEY